MSASGSNVRLRLNLSLLAILNERKMGESPSNDDKKQPKERELTVSQHPQPISE